MPKAALDTTAGRNPYSDDDNDSQDVHSDNDDSQDVHSDDSNSVISDRSQYLTDVASSVSSPTYHDGEDLQLPPNAKDNAHMPIYSQRKRPSTVAEEGHLNKALPVKARVAKSGRNLFDRIDTRDDRGNDSARDTVQGPTPSTAELRKRRLAAIDPRQSRGRRHQTEASMSDAQAETGSTHANARLTTRGRGRGGGGDGLEKRASTEPSKTASNTDQEFWHYRSGKQQYMVHSDGRVENIGESCNDLDERRSLRTADQKIDILDNRLRNAEASIQATELRHPGRGNLFMTTITVVTTEKTAIEKCPMFRTVLNKYKKSPNITIVLSDDIHGSRNASRRGEGTENEVSDKPNRVPQLSKHAGARSRRHPRTRSSR